MFNQCYNMKTKTKLTFVALCQTEFTMKYRTGKWKAPWICFSLPNYVDPARGVRGTSTFTMVSCHPTVSQHLCPHPSVPDISYSFLLMGFKFTDMVSMDKTLNWLTFHDFDWIFNVTGDHYVTKLTLFMQYFL